MKKFVFIFLVGITLSFPSCKQSDSLYVDYIVPNGITYPGIALDVESHPGRYRIEIAWLNGSDPNVVKARIYWNNYTEWQDLDIPPGADTIRHIIGPLDENTYSFMIRTIDTKGNLSVPVEVIGVVYGDLYFSSLFNRAIKTDVFDVFDKILVLNWYNADPSEIGVNLSYTDTNGNQKTMLVDPSETTTVINDIDIDQPLVYNTMYLPDSMAIDIFSTANVEKRTFTLAFSGRDFIPKTNWTELVLPNDAIALSGYPVSNIWNENYSNYNGFFSGYNFGFPQWITWDMGVNAILGSLKIWHILDASPRLYGGESPRRFEIWGAVELNETGEWDDSWIPLGQFLTVPPSGSTTPTPDDIAFGRQGIECIFSVTDFAPNPFVPVRYIRFKTLETFNSVLSSPDPDYGDRVAFGNISFYGLVVED